MSGIPSVGGTQGVSAGTAFEIAAIKKQKDVIEELGQMAVQLIQSSSILDPAVGRNLDITG